MICQVLLDLCVTITVIILVKFVVLRACTFLSNRFVSDFIFKPFKCCFNMKMIMKVEFKMRSAGIYVSKSTNYYTAH